MNRHALEVLELPAALELVAARARSQAGRERIRALTPRDDSESVRRELIRVGEVVSFLRENPEWRPPELPDTRGVLRKLALEGAVLEPPEVFAVGRLLEAGRLLREGLGGTEFPTLVELRQRLYRDREMERLVARTVDGEGNVLDSASRELRGIRSRLRRARSRIVRALEAFLKSLPERYVVPDASVTIREGRYVIPLRREGKGEVGGIVHDESATGTTLFVEPPVAIRLANEIRELEKAEEREVHRILREVTGRMRALREALEGSQEALVDLDVLLARAEAALAWGGAVPEVLPPGTEDLRIVAGRHPLLLASLEEETVPFDLELGPGERGLVVSGPNTGGKSVLLKAVGLLAALTQCGVVPPVGPGTRLPVFREIFADIGDEQSIARSLSTFSAHLGNLMEIVEGAGPDSLVLIDEMGTGTDPREGAALARAVLEELVARGTLAVVTSHLGELKRLDRPGSGIVNASLQFDPDRLAPTYRLVKGRPGRSYGLAIARRLGFPASVLDRAEGYVGDEEARLDALLESLERNEEEAHRLRRRLERKAEEAARLEAELREREVELRAREHSAEERARTEARRLLLDARREVEEVIREVRAAVGPEGVDAAARSGRRRLEEAVRELRPRGEGAGREPAGRAPPPLAPGDRVRIGVRGARGVLVEVRADRGVVDASGVRLQVPLVDLLPDEAPGEGEEAPAARRGGGGWRGPAVDAEVEVDLRGLRVAEVDEVLLRALDRAVLADLPELRVIHGKGTGAVRQRVHEILAGEPRVREFRLGAHGEGGAGVTVVVLR